MNWVVWLITGIVIIAAIMIFLFFPAGSPVPEANKACINADGTVKTQQCCSSASDFPNSCLIGACGCSLENSHEVKVCDCGEGKCWDGTKCV